MQIIKLVIDCEIGTDIRKCAEQMVDLSREHQCVVSTDFNGVELIAKSYMVPAEIVGYYHGVLDGRKS